MEFKFEFNDKYFPVIQNLDKKYELITSGKRLFEEGKIQHNCVYSYYNKIKNGNCIIYSEIALFIHYLKIIKDLPLKLLLKKISLK